MIDHFVNFGLSLTIMKCIEFTLIAAILVIGILYILEANWFKTYGIIFMYLLALILGTTHYTMFSYLDDKSTFYKVDKVIKLNPITQDSGCSSEDYMKIGKNSSDKIALIFNDKNGDKNLTSVIEVNEMPEIFKEKSNISAVGKLIVLKKEFQDKKLEGKFPYNKFYEIDKQETAYKLILPKCQ